MGQVRDGGRGRTQRHSQRGELLEAAVSVSVGCTANTVGRWLRHALSRVGAGSLGSAVWSGRSFWPAEGVHGVWAEESGCPGPFL